MNSDGPLELWQQLHSTPEIFDAIAAAEGSELQRQTQLRSQYPAELVRLALELTSLREQARLKFSLADQLWMTRQSLEQSSSEELAIYKARRLRTAVPDNEPVLDFCTGLGADAIALAAGGTVITYDLDPVVLQLARWNAETYGVADRIEFRQQDVNDVEVAGRVLHLDPDQRDASGKRQRRLELIQPNLEKMQQLAMSCRAGVIKLSPASNFGGKFPECEVELVSWRGECKQALIWCGELAEPEQWRATVLPAGASLVGDPLSAYPQFGEVAAFIYDPDPAVVRAGMINHLSEETGASRLDEAEEYLTSNELIASPFMAAFEVHEVLGRNEKELRRWIRSNDIGSVEIKCRHLKIDVEKTRKSLPLQGAGTATVIFARVGGKSKVIVCSRVSEQQT
ncbi:class I SAM-dependent methyltransferase [Rubinisphaera margarita]|uniref:class I SAM-dependent methyltransferase n=1 Tax=Rubinisphaera margarita TaxID=2909586 RepID=UPI001EE9553A|nr:class I SAM-dependent methyltransferase [Rubinisphaera margarita]MCG6154235.1 class I SAM-dependent methyltransferase [Rubinisphaera margarita]